MCTSFFSNKIKSQFCLPQQHCLKISVDLAERYVQKKRLQEGHQDLHPQEPIIQPSVALQVPQTGQSEG